MRKGLYTLQPHVDKYPRLPCYLDKYYQEDVHFTSCFIFIAFSNEIPITHFVGFNLSASNVPTRLCIYILVHSHD